MKLTLFLVAMLTLPLVTKAQTESPVDTMTRLRNWIEADAEELSWERIPWLESFGPGIVAAHKQQKPLLLWVMNGHPLGCT
jgi:hypothetical protein